jgi:large subunit ribosomal protein L28
VLTGNKVSHSNIKTKKRFLPNIQSASLISEALGVVKLKIASSTIRAIEHNDGIDSFMAKTPSCKLTKKGQSLKKRILDAQSKAKTK